MAAAGVSRILLTQRLTDRKTKSFVTGHGFSRAEKRPNPMAF